MSGVEKILDRFFEDATAAEPIVIEAEAVDAVNFCQLRLDRA